MAFVTPTDVATGEVLTASRYNADVVENVSQLYTSQRRIDIVTRAANTTVATTANLSSPNELFTTDLSFTAAGSTEYLVEIYIPYTQTASNANASINVWITNGSTTGIAIVGALGSGNGSQAIVSHLFVRYRYTPSAGTVTLNVAGTHGGAAGLIGSASADYAPSHMAVYGPAIT